MAPTTPKERVLATLTGTPPDGPPPCAPILHTGLAPIVGVPLGEYFTSAERMAHTIVEGQKRFGYEGVQLSSGVTAEAEALGAPVEQPADAAPLLQGHIVATSADLVPLRDIDPTRGGRLPMFREAVERTADALGDDACVIATIRGPLLMAAQLMGVETVLMTAMTDPDETAAILDFTTEVAERVGSWLADAGASAVVIGEATCSPNFIAPAMYREIVRPRHRRLIDTLHTAGWRAAGLHICGNVSPIVGDIIDTGTDFFDVDYQAPLDQVLEAADGRIAMRGNIDPSSQLRFGKPDDIQTATGTLVQQTRGKAWVVSSGCDIPPATPPENIEAMVRATRQKW